MTRAASIAAGLLVLVALVFIWRELEPPKPKLRLADDGSVLFDGGALSVFKTLNASDYVFRMPSDEAARFMLQRGWPTDAGIAVECLDGAKVALYTDDAGVQRLVCR